MLYLFGVLVLFIYFANFQPSKSSKSSLFSNSPSTDPRSAGGSSGGREDNISENRTVERLTETIPSKPVTGDFERSTRGFIPADKCPCGGTWIKHQNRNTGGRFFGCSRYPKCKNTRDKQERQNRPRVRVCPNGHERTIWNTERNDSGREVCLDCREERELRRIDYLDRQSRYSQGRDNTEEVCRNGHPRTSENTYIRPDGQRECRICRRNAR